MWAKLNIKTKVDSEIIYSQLIEWGFPVLWVEEEKGVKTIFFDKVEQVENNVDWEAQARLHSPFYQDGKIEFEGLSLTPGAGFGDLSHPTTQLMVELMHHLSDEVYDLGTGNGVLACIAKARKVQHVSAWDIDQEALNLAKLNASRNQLYIDFNPVEKTKTLLMNMTFGEQKEAFNGIKAEEMITSGILSSQRDEYLKWLKDFHVVEEKEKEGWLAFRLRAK